MVLDITSTRRRYRDWKRKLFSCLQKAQSVFLDVVTYLSTQNSSVIGSFRVISMMQGKDNHKSIHIDRNPLAWL